MSQDVTIGHELRQIREILQKQHSELKVRLVEQAMGGLCAAIPNADPKDIATKAVAIGEATHHALAARLKRP